MATARFVEAGEFPEKTSWEYECIMVSERGELIPLAALTTLTLTIHSDAANKPIVNGVDAVNILNIGRGTVGAADGKLIVTFTADDMQILDDTATTETHVATLECRFGAGGAKGWNREIVHKVRNLAKVT